MFEDQVVRRLAAIVAADIVGYSRLMEANEEQTLVTLRRHRREFIDPTIATYGGRIFKVMGDGLLVEFGSVLSAARCAVDVQRGMLTRNADIPQDRHFKFRVGINFGDLLVEGDDYYGDGVNMAVRLQGLAGPGDITCSAAVREALGNKLDVDFADLGQRSVKNISHPLHVYALNWGEGAHVAPSHEVGQTRRLSDKPSIAILPFANLSDDPEQGYFSDGITEDIITDLSNVSGLFVLSRNTVFAFRNRARSVERAAKELGVAYVVEGSVRKAGNRVRINAELTDGVSDGHIWGARYDRDLTDIFAVQDEIAKSIVEQLKVKLLPDEQRAIERAPTDNVEAYTHYLRGREYYHIASRANHLMARQSFARAIELDDRYARAYAGIAACDIRLKSSYGSPISIESILATADKALAIDPGLAEAYSARGFALSVDGRRAEAISAFEHALALDPNCHEANRYYAEFCVTDGQFDLAAKLFQRGIEIKPTDYGGSIMLINVFRSLGEKEKARRYAQIGVKRCEEELAAHPENANCACLGATALAFVGDRDRAVQWLDRALATDPGDINIQYNAACTFALLGEVERAVDVLAAWVPQVGTEMKLWFRNDSDFDSIRTHPYYRKLLEMSE
jgi:adenylate cyclase